MCGGWESDGDASGQAEAVSRNPIVRMVSRSQMTWTTLQNSKSRVNRAGIALRGQTLSQAQLSEHVAIINNFRASHAFPLNTLQMRLRSVAGSLGVQFDVTQRIKRLRSIKSKLQRIKGLHLSQLQDVGGCRIVVPETHDVTRLVGKYRSGHARHHLVRADDYIAKPKPHTGYRAYHLVYKYHSERNATYNGTRLEVQFRSKLQHAWAMAVETVDVMYHDSLKIGQGDDARQRFFALCSSMFALREGTEPVPNTPASLDSLKNEAQDIDAQIGILKALQSGAAFVDLVKIEKTDLTDWYLLHLVLDKNIINVGRFPKSEMHDGMHRYFELERECENDDNQDVVFVSAESMDSLKRTYPSYFNHVYEFLTTVDESMSLID